MKEENINKNRPKPQDYEKKCAWVQEQNQGWKKIILNGIVLRKEMKRNRELILKKHSDMARQRRRIGVGRYVCADREEKREK